MFAKIISFFMSIITFICSLFGIGIKEIDTTEMIQYAEDNKSVMIVLEENGSTGYLWNVSVSDENVVKLTDEETYNTAPEGLVGAPVTKVFTFDAVAAGEATLELAYARNWEDGAIRTLKFDVTVDNDLNITAVLVSDSSVK